MMEERMISVSPTAVVAAEGRVNIGSSNTSASFRFIRNGRVSDGRENALCFTYCFDVSRRKGGDNSSWGMSTSFRFIAATSYLERYPVAKCCYNAC